MQELTSRLETEVNKSQEKKKKKETLIESFSLRGCSFFFFNDKYVQEYEHEMTVLDFVYSLENNYPSFSAPCIFLKIIIILKSIFSVIIVPFHPRSHLHFH